VIRDTSFHLPVVVCPVLLLVLDMIIVRDSATQGSERAVVG
jgi:hypothetical protein